MRNLEITPYIKSERLSTSCVDLDSVGHQYASPLRTGAYERVGSETIRLRQEDQILLDTAIRACDRMEWNLVIEDVSTWSFLKKLKSKETIPRLEANNKILMGTPTSDEIIQFFKCDCGDGLPKVPVS
ncbi:MAG: hypothetical protein ACFFD6_02760 [Candidatus Thorarchaeota archaeon]